MGPVAKADAALLDVLESALLHEGAAASRAGHTLRQPRADARVSHLEILPVHRRRSWPRLRSQRYGLFACFHLGKTVRRKRPA